jgi:VanZ family protein
MNSRTIILTVLFSLVLLAIVFSADSGTLPGILYNIYTVPYGDKAGHFILTGLLSLLVNLSLLCRKTHLASRDFLLGSLLVGVVVTIEEITQVFFPSRNASLTDLLASYLGIWLFGRLADWLTTRRKTPKSAY